MCHFANLCQVTLPANTTRPVTLGAVPVVCAQSPPTLHSAMDCSTPGSSVLAIFQARILEWVAISSSKGSSWPRHQTHISNISCFGRHILYHWVTWENPSELVAQIVKNLPAMQKTQVQSLGWEDTLEKGMATHSSILSWKISWVEEPGGLQSMGSWRVGHDRATDTWNCGCVQSHGRHLSWVGNKKGPQQN